MRLTVSFVEYALPLGRQTVDSVNLCDPAKAFAFARGKYVEIASLPLVIRIDRRQRAKLPLVSASSRR